MKQVNYAKIRRLLLFVLMMLMLLSGCREDKETITELWVVIDNDRSTGMYGQAGVLATAFEEEHQGVKVKLDILPTDEAKRETYLEHLRVQIMAGQGPDAYILPVSTSAYREQLFKDVALSMYNGLFADISEYYDADSALDTEALISAVMDAGCVGDARYVLPLRYDIPVAYVDRAQLKAAGLDEELFASGMVDLLNAVLASGDTKLAEGARARWLQERFAMNFFPEIVDYQSQEVKVAAGQIAEYLLKYQNLTAMIGTDPAYFIPHFGSYCISETFWANDGYSFYIGTMSDALMNGAIAKYLDMDLGMYPIAASDGSVVADITYYCAVGAGCKDPALAYEYLRLFLLKESQWEENRRVSSTAGEGLIASGWPVRAAGSTEKLWNNLCDQKREIAYESSIAQERSEYLLRIELTDEDLPILEAEIDTARFSISTEYDLSYVLTEKLNDFTNDYAPVNMDINAFVEELIYKLQLHVAEG